MSRHEENRFHCHFRSMTWRKVWNLWTFSLLTPARKPSCARNPRAPAVNVGGCRNLVRHAFCQRHSNKPSDTWSQCHNSVDLVCGRNEFQFTRHLCDTERQLWSWGAGIEDNSLTQQFLQWRMHRRLPPCWKSISAPGFNLKNRTRNTSWTRQLQENLSFESKSDQHPGGSCHMVRTKAGQGAVTKALSTTDYRSTLDAVYMYM